MEYVVQTQIIEDQVVAKPLSMKVRRPSKNESSTTKYVLFTWKKLGLQMFGSNCTVCTTILRIEIFLAKQKNYINILRNWTT